MAIALNTTICSHFNTKPVLVFLFIYTAMVPASIAIPPKTREETKIKSNPRA